MRGMVGQSNRSSARFGTLRRIGVRSPGRRYTTAHADSAGESVWGASAIEKALDPGLPIVDSDHHLWVDSEIAVAHHLPRTYALHELLEDIDSGHNIRATA